MEQKKSSNILKQSAKSILEKDPKIYLPSRYQVEMYQPKSPKLVFNQLEEFAKTSYNSKNTKKFFTRDDQTNKQPKRQLKDYEHFTDIFVKPKQNLLKTMKDFEFLPSEFDTVSKSELNQYVNKALNLPAKNTQQKSRNIYDEQIKVEPPSFLNCSIASPLTPGNGYAPSIPPVHLIKEGKSYLKDLLLRCQNGSMTEDVEKQSHLSFFLGLAYEKSQQYELAIKFFHRFMRYAKIMDDRIGLVLGANRIGCNQFYLKNYERSILFHQQNIRLSDPDNVFSGMYNLGIINRKMEKYNESIQLFASSLQWALERRMIEQICLVYGQLGTTYLQIKQYQQSFKYFQKCLQVSKVSNKRVYLDSLLMILKLSVNHSIESKEDHQKIIQTSLNLAEELNLPNVVELCLCNLGILRVKREEKERKLEEVNEIEILQ